MTIHSLKDLFRKFKNIFSRKIELSEQQKREIKDGVSIYFGRQSMKKYIDELQESK